MQGVPASRADWYCILALSVPFNMYLFQYGINKDGFSGLRTSDDVAVRAAGLVVQLPQKHTIRHCRCTIELKRLSKLFSLCLTCLFLSRPRCGHTW
jgi:hypothetical protein